LPSINCPVFGVHYKERSIPLWKSTKILIKKWLPKIDSDPQAPLFPNRFGKMMTRSGVEDRIKSAIKKAFINCPSLKNKKVSPHIIRHTTAMHLLQSGVDITVIALWLGHESIITTHKYMEADLQMKTRVLNAVQDPKQKVKNKPLPDSLIAFLEGL
jgi:integrase/recombinase XerD